MISARKGKAASVNAGAAFLLASHLTDVKFPK